MKALAFAILTIVAGVVAADAATCYKKVGGACVQSSTGNLQSDCARSCSVSQWEGNVQVVYLVGACAKRARG
jgi:hypothetical protein